MQMNKIYPLRALTTRDADDTTIALMDAWATVADVLTFYQERIANEGYLRTATERRSILELARLIGYALRSGVASTVYLAYTLDEDKSVSPPKPTAVTIPAGARAQSVPGPGELPQSFETSDDLEARSQWNTLQVRLTQPQTKDSILPGNGQGSRVYLKGINTNLKPNDPLLIDFGTGIPVPFRVINVEADVAADRTRVLFRPWITAQQAAALVRETARHFQATERFGVDKNTEMAKRVLALLHNLESRTRDAPLMEVMANLEQETLPKLKEQHQISADNQYAKLEPWLGQMIETLERARQSLNQSVSFGRADGTGLGAVTPNGAVRADEASVLSKRLVDRLQLAPSVPPANASRLERSVGSLFAPKTDLYPRLLNTLNPALESVLYPALSNAEVTPRVAIKVYALRLAASLFGHNAPKKPLRFNRDGTITETGEWPIVELVPHTNGEGQARIKHEDPRVIDLSSNHEKIMPGSWLVVETGQTSLTSADTILAKATNPDANVSRADYGISGKITRIELESVAPGSSDPLWITADLDKITPSDADFQAIRRTRVYAEAEELVLDYEPITDEICGGKDEPIELNDLYSNLQPGRWLIVSGERTDIKNEKGVIAGVNASELVMLAGVEQRYKEELAGDKIHTFIRLAEALAYCYKRDTVTIYGNVVKATHGETRNEVLGGGDGSKALQQFTLKQPPLTFVSAPNPSGIDSTLQVRVNDVLWHETDSLAGSSPADRKFITRTDDEGKTTVIFGNGQEGARLPTGLENVKAVYRNGIGKPGNVKAEQITLLATRPLGVKEVTNPMRASGGADKESRDQARQNAPLAVMALDRLVSTQDYADFARTFAGIGKASVARLSDGRREVVHVTIAGADDIPIEKSSDLYRNLVKALHDFGDPYLPIQVDVRELLALVISAKVRVLPDYVWEKVEPKIRAAFLDEFGFQWRELGQAVFLSEVHSAIQRVSGIAYVDVDVLTTISEVELFTPDLLKEKIDNLTAAGRPDSVVPVRLAEATGQVKEGRSTSTAVDDIYPAQLAFLIPDVPDTLILNEVTR